MPDDVVYTSRHFYPEVQGFRPPRDLFVHIYGVDLVHLGDGCYVVLEDNLLENPEMFVAQEALDFSRHMVLNERTGMLEPRHVDLRVFAIQGADGEVTVFPVGLTRVALEGGRITNNSSGGLCKPTWVLS